MKTSTLLARRFREVLLNGTWVANTNYKDALSDVSWQQATTPISTLNSILALTFHINYYLDGVLKVFEGGPLSIRDKYSFDYHHIDTAAAWARLLKQLFENAETFARHIEQMTDEQLQAAFVDQKYGSYQRNIEGMIEHCYYHLGQISLIKKMVL
jgi:uncharacterized damage-inducible protein DinB